MTICKKCGEQVPYTRERCTVCGTDAGFPNVRAAEREQERRSLDDRYRKALEESKTRGAYDELTRFDEAVKTTIAVINVDIDYLLRFLTQDSLLYTNYSLGVKAEMRKPADPRDDKRRLAIEATLFGSYAENIRYAALSLDGSGLKSYGAYAMKLRDLTIEDRATLLEENSYDFVPKHAITPGDEIPPGYVATWRERNKLAVSKLAGQILPGTSDAEHSKILISSDGDRANDNFIEVHIYKGFDNNAIESVRGSSSVKGKSVRALVSKVKDRLKKAGKDWIEE